MDSSVEIAAKYALPIIPNGTGRSLISPGMHTLIRPPTAAVAANSCAQHHPGTSKTPLDATPPAIAV
jgi:hypothetical protein